MTSLEGTVGVIHQNINRLQHDLSAYFTFQGFHPPPFPSPHPSTPVDDSQALCVYPAAEFEDPEETS